MYQNELTKLFESAITAEDFVKIWKAKIAPQLSPEGIYSITSLNSTDETRNRSVPFAKSGYSMEESSRKRPATDIVTASSENAQKRLAIASSESTPNKP